MSRQRPGAGTGRRRLFFAWWPDEALRQRIGAATGPLLRGIDGVPVPAANLHVTLAFLGSTPEHRVAALLDLGSALVAPAVALRFTGLAHWRRARALVALSDAPPPATALVQALWQQLALMGYRPDLRPWRPHLTLLRRLRQAPPPLAMPPLDWPPMPLALVESLPGERGPDYRPLASWPPAGPGR